MSEEYSEKYVRTRRFWIVLPVMILPIVTIFFWLMGGGKAAGSVQTAKSGMNMQLPDAAVNKDSAADKMSFYMAADVDSSRRVEQLRNDPYRKDTTVVHVERVVERSYEMPDVLSSKMAAITKRVVVSEVEEEPGLIQKKPVTRSEFVPDPELEAINGTLEKLMAIQNPQKAVIKNTSVADAAYTVKNDEGVDSTFFGKRKPQRSTFLQDGVKPKNASITAVIPTEQVLQNGSLVKIEIKTPITVKDVTLPSGTNVFGIASLDNERLIIRIPTVRYQNNLLPVALSVYDLDGMEGIYIPGAVLRDVVKSSGDNAIQSAGISSFDMSLKTQAVAAGVGAAKSFLSKKVKQQRVTLSAGYQVLLFDTKQNMQ